MACDGKIVGEMGRAKLVILKVDTSSGDVFGALVKDHPTRYSWRGTSRAL